MNEEVRLLRVFASEIATLKEYVAALLAHDEDYDSMIHIEEGVASLMKNESLATPYFIFSDKVRIGYVVLTRYHSVKNGGVTFYIDELYVEEPHRRKGVGNIILGKIIEAARIEGGKTLWVQVERSNLPAQSFFTQNGFAVDPNISFSRPL